MKRYIIFDKTNGNIDSVVSWGDGRDMPTDYPLNVNQEIKTITDDSIQVDGISYCYDKVSEFFKKKLRVGIDAVQINSLDGTANITIEYPEAVDEVCSLEIDGQAVEINIVNGKAVIPFSSQVLGWHNISISSTSHYGKDSVNVEVV